MLAKNLLFTGITLIASVPQATAAPPDLTFLCNNIPEICTNMCWAVRCANPTFPQGLTFDFPPKSTKDARRKAAGCGRDNKCSPKGSGQTGHRGPPNVSCDEYPFASTKEADSGQQVSRCVPVAEQNSQGGSLSSQQQKWKKENKTYFTIGFGNPGNSKYCNNEACDNDGFQVQDGKATKRSANDPVFRYYRTISGMTIASLDDIEMHSNFTRQADAEEVLVDGTETWTEAVEGGVAHDGGHNCSGTSMEFLP
ncbi:hypothetical protein PT974_07736 [Cladobotryum mycophilum]|uniref:Deoxyribonuclease NucA/NucB domain-containing protein n=1 Tax=Cladobotryum mycophilum TaxID=491253 RepID=A0ABR0SHR3_9HYPO